MAKKPRIHMSIEDRAKQFMPFSALRGLQQVLAQKERIVVPKAELSEERSEELDRKLHLLQRGKMAAVIYFHQDSYVQVTGLVARIDKSSRILQIVNTKIPFDDIYDIRLPSDASSEP